MPQPKATEPLSETTLFVHVPVVAMVAALAVYALLVGNIESLWSKTVFGYCMAVVSVLFALPALYAPSQRSIDAAKAVSALILCGFLALTMFACIYSEHGFAESEQFGELQFRDYIYFSIVTFTTLGYGDFQPASELRLLASFEALFGYMFLGFLVAVVNDQSKNEP